MYVRILIKENGKMNPINPRQTSLRSVFSYMSEVKIARDTENPACYLSQYFE